MVKFWCLKDDTNNEISETEISSSYQALDLMKESTGIEYFKINLESYTEDGSFYQKLKSERGFIYEDMVDWERTNSPEFEIQAKIFFEEHLHEDDEVRFIISGSGYFDVRNISDGWIRIQVFPGDLLIIPAGIYHRFSLDENGYVKCIRLFSGDPKWTPISRPADENIARQNYLQAMSIKFEK